MKIMKRLLIFVFILTIAVSVFAQEKPTRLHYAVEAEDIAEIKNLLAHNAYIDAVDDFGNTPLHWAIWKKNAEVVKILIDHNANVNIQEDAFHLAPIHIAVRLGTNDIFDILLKVKTIKLNLRTTRGTTALHEAVLAHNYYMMSALVARKDVDLNAQDINLSTPLHLAAASDDKLAAFILVEAGAKLKVRDMENQTPLDLAKRKWHKEFIAGYQDALKKVRNMQTQKFYKELVEKRTKDEQMMKNISNTWYTTTK